MSLVCAVGSLVAATTVENLPFQWRGTLKITSILKGTTMAKGEQKVVEVATICLKERRKIIVKDNRGRIVGQISVLADDGSLWSGSVGGELVIPMKDSSAHTTILTAAGGRSRSFSGWVYTRLADTSPLDDVLPNGSYSLTGSFFAKDGLHYKSETITPVGRFPGASAKDLEVDVHLGAIGPFQNYNDPSGTDTAEISVTVDAIRRTLESCARYQPGVTTLMFGRLRVYDCVRKELQGCLMTGSLSGTGPTTELYGFQWGMEWSVGKVRDIRPMVYPVDEAWRPMGESKGEPAVIRADIPDLSELRGKWIFTLYDVSREKGFCLNGGDDTDPDLVFTANQAGFTTDPSTAEGPVVETTDLRNAVEVRVDSRDYGAWGRLRAEVYYEGVAYLAHTADGKDHVTIPLDKDDDRIADGWEDDWSLAGKGADVDDDDSPEDVGLENGDGFTNYEEYRGFLVQGQWTETMPVYKDLFICDLNNLGVGNLGDLQMSVHLIRPEEFDASHVVNFNRGWGTLRSQSGQKGILMKDASIADAAGEVTFGLALGGPGCPNVIDCVLVDSAAVRADLFEYLECITAHELGHAINMMHHGYNDFDGIARRGGIWSGNVGCLMRYQQPAYYYAADGVAKYPYPSYEGARSRVIYCNDKTGTGINAPGERVTEDGRPLPVAADATAGACRKCVALKGSHRDGR